MNSVNVYHEIYVKLKDRSGNDIEPEFYELDSDYDDKIYVYLKSVPFVMDDSALLKRIKDIAREKCPEFLPHLDDLELQLSLEYLREC